MVPSALQSFRANEANVSSDIFAGVFEWIFDDEAFQKWREGKGAWQLHWIGGPGSGKTILTTLISRHLNDYFRAEQYPIITIRIFEDVPNRQTDLIEDFLEAVYQELKACPSLLTDNALIPYTEYKRMRDPRKEGFRIRERLRLLRKAVYTQLESTDNLHAYLILDGIDRCESTLRFLLESELAELQERGVSILLTSRLAIFENDRATCDHSSLPEPERNALSVFLQCRTCGDAVVCLPCVKAGKLCPYCDEDSELYEPYQHVTRELGVPPDKMVDFIAWDLEREHGDLGLQSLAMKPPLSQLGKSLLLNQGTRPIQTIIDDIKERSDGNIGIARARLDLIHDMESLDDLESKKDSLPATVTALFDYGLRQIEALPARERDIALKSMAAAGRSLFGSSIPDLRVTLEMLGNPGIRSGEEFVEAARGWLVVSTKEDPQRLQVFNTNFLYYVQQRYHQGLHRSSTQIDSHYRQRNALLEAEATGYPARFEPQNTSETPARVTPYKLARTVTAMPAIEEAPVFQSIVRKGTVAWT